MRICHALQTLYYRTKGLVINYGEAGVQQNGEIAGKLLFEPPPPFKTGLNFLCPLLQYGYNFKATALNYPNTFCDSPPPFSMAKTFSGPPFAWGKTSHAPLPFCSPPPRN